MADGRDGTVENSTKESGSKLDWHHVWKSVQDAGSQAGQAIKKQVEKIDTKELGDKAKHTAGEGLKALRGKSDNHQVNEISDSAAKYLPGVGLVRKGAEIAHETGVDGKILEGKKGPLRAPSEKTMKEAGKEALGSMITVPGGGKIAGEILNKSGIKEKAVDRKVDSAAGELESKQNHSHHFRKGEK